MACFTKEYISFFTELSKNSNKEWFDKNRTRYADHAWEPFKYFVQQMILNIQKLDTEVAIKPNDAIFRINNDTRFNPDKPPYKTYCAAVFQNMGVKIPVVQDYTFR